MDESEAIPPRPLNLPLGERAHYGRNFLRQAVCELRFPTMLEYERQPPLSFSKSVRKEYPIYEPIKSLRVDASGVEQKSGHAFRSKNRRWSIAVSAAAISLETTMYDSFEDFEARLSFVLRSAKNAIDSEFFTRVGLRYVNSLPLPGGAVAGWVNPALIGAWADGIYGDVEEHMGRVRGITAIGGYTFSHGLALQNGIPLTDYVLDFDFFKDDVEFGDALSVVRKLHAYASAMFHWAIGDEARRHLGPSTFTKG